MTNTLSLIVRHEMRRLWRSRALLPLLLAFAALCAYAAWSGMQWTAQRNGALADIRAEESKTQQLRRKQIAEKVTPENRSFYGGALFSTAMSLRATLPPGELAVLTVGQAEGYPMAASVFPFAASNTLFDDHVAGLENPSILAAGRIDLAFVLVYLFPLLLLAGSFDLWSAERESGAAPWLLSQPVPAARYLLAKAAARWFALALPMLAALLMVLWWAGARDAGGLALTLAIGAAYGLFWLGLAALVNVYARSGAQAALGCLAGWLAVVVLAPALALVAVDVAAPPSNPGERVNALRAQAMQARAESRAAARTAAVPNTAAAAAGKPNIPDSLRRRAVEVERGEHLIRQVSARFRAQDERRQHWMDAMRFASPAIAVQDALERVAGADAARARLFQDQAHAFLLGVRVLVQRDLDADRLLTVADYDRGLPQFAFREPALAGRLAALGLDLAAIAVFLAALLWCGARRLRKQSHFFE